MTQTIFNRELAQDFDAYVDANGNPQDLRRSSLLNLRWLINKAREKQQLEESATRETFYVDENGLARKTP